MNNGTMFIFGYSEIIPYLTVYLQDELDMNVRALIWHYTNRTVPSLKFWQRSHDTILCCWKKKHKPHFVIIAAAKVGGIMFNSKFKHQFIYSQ